MPEVVSIWDEAMSDELSTLASFFACILTSVIQMFTYLMPELLRIWDGSE